MTTNDIAAVAYSHSPAANVVLEAAGRLEAASRLSGRLPVATGLPEQIARPLAELLQNIGDAMHDYNAAELKHPENIPSYRWLVYPDGDINQGYREHWTDALRLARALLGHTDPNAASNTEAVAR